MKKPLLKNPFILTLLLLVLTAVIGYLIALIAALFKMSSIGGLSGLIAAMFLGQIYTGKFKEVMDKKLRKQVALFFILIQFILGLFLLPILTGGFQAVYAVTFVIISIVFYFIVYWSLGWGGRIYLNAVKKSEEMKKKKKKQ